MMFPVPGRPIARGARCGAVLLVVVLSAVLLGACGPKTSSGNAAPTGVTASSSAGVDTDTDYNGACPTAGNSRAFAKTRFALHAGLGLGAFHRYIYKPAKNGNFKAGADKRTSSFAKAAVAGLFTVHELKVAKGFALANPTLCNTVQSISDSFTNLVGKFKNGTATQADIDSSQNSFTSLQQEATRDGFNFDEKNVTVPGAG